MNTISYSPSFKGYGAMPLRGLYVTDKNCAQALKKLSLTTGLDVFTPNIASKSIKKEIYDLQQKSYLMWAQDYITFLKNKTDIVLFDSTREHLKRVLRASADGIKKTLGFEPVKLPMHLRGGNFFICENKGRREMLLGENKAKEFPEEFLKTVYGVEKIHSIPRLDYHIDLFIRPLNDGNVLVADYELTKDMLKSGIKKIQNYIKNANPDSKERAQLEEVCNQLGLYLEKFEITERFAPYKHKDVMPKLIEKLEDSGYKPIRVPGNYYYLQPVKDKAKEKEMLNNFHNNMDFLKDISKNDDPRLKSMVDKFIELQTFKAGHDETIGVNLTNKYENNFLNAIVSEKDGKPVYITNAPLLDRAIGITQEIEAKTGFSTKNAFIESIKDYVAKENIHFIDDKTTERLFNTAGGIHCTAAEII